MNHVIDRIKTKSDIKEQTVCNWNAIITLDFKMPSTNNSKGVTREDECISTAKY